MNLVYGNIDESQAKTHQRSPKTTKPRKPGLGLGALVQARHVPPLSRASLVSGESPAVEVRTMQHGTHTREVLARQMQQLKPIRKQTRARRAKISP